jgi:hypothetical protein
MKGYKNIVSRNYAVSEVVGGIMLVLIAVVAFSLIYMYLIPDPPDINPSVEIYGEVTNTGKIVLSHKGGSALTNYEIDIRYYENNTHIGSKIINNDNWKINQYRYPLDLLELNGFTLIDENCKVNIQVQSINSDGSKTTVFNGVLSGKINIIPDFLGDLMLISTLKTNTTDEDLICFNNTIKPNIDAKTYIYNWLVNDIPFTNILMPFDTNDLSTTKDYSGNEHNGTINGASWNSGGVIGGSYQFDGVDNYISLPHCFDENYVDEITVECWFKTSEESGVISSYDRNKIYELLIDNGYIRWFTYANDGQDELLGDTYVSDNIWHHVAATYDYETGDSSIYLDGELEASGNMHNPNSFLGTGESVTGLIGATNSGTLPGEWRIITYDDFEEGFGNYTDGGRDCKLYTYGTYAHQGSNAANIQDNNGYSSSFYHTNGIDVQTPGYNSIKVEFWFYSNSLESWEHDGFRVHYHDGSSWNTVADYDVGDEFENDQFYHETIWINKTDYTFPINMKILFESRSSSDYDDIYIDEVYVNATTGSKSIDNFTGSIDEFHIYNRVLSDEQAYQNYLCTKDGYSDKSVIVSDETLTGNIWSCIVTPNDGAQDDEPVESNSLQIIGYGGG